jgi:hypothetical protein
LIDTSNSNSYGGMVTTVDTNTGEGKNSLALTGHLDTVNITRPDSFHRLDTYTFDTTLTSVTGLTNSGRHSPDYNSYDHR